MSAASLLFDLARRGCLHPLSEGALNRVISEVGTAGRWVCPSCACHAFGVAEVPLQAEARFLGTSCGVCRGGGAPIVEAGFCRFFMFPTEVPR